MKLKEKGHTIIVKFNESTFAEFVNKVVDQYEAKLMHHNVIIDLTQEGQHISNEDIQAFEDLAVQHIEENNKSFVLIAESIDFNEYDEDLIVVPSLQEAHDLIEMDEIQRDLGF